MPAAPDGATTVLVAGATGLVGRECVRLLAADEAVAEVRALVRRHRPPTAAEPRVRECLVDFDRLDPHEEFLHVDQVFCALGTTLREAGSRAAFRRVDYDYPLRIAAAARAGGARHLLLVSAVGADPHSRFFYNRVKGELEEAVLRLGYRSVTMARPSLLLGTRATRRPGEELGQRLGWLLPERWKPVPAARVALALVRAARADAPGLNILENPALRATV